MVNSGDIPGDKHPPPHRVWTHLHAEPKFDIEEENHVTECRFCMRIYMLCLNSSTFGAVLRVLREDNQQTTT